MRFAAWFLWLVTLPALLVPAGLSWSLCLCRDLVCESVDPCCVTDCCDESDDGTIRVGADSRCAGCRSFKSTELDESATPKSEASAKFVSPPATAEFCNIAAAPRLLRLDPKRFARSHSPPRAGAPVPLRV